MHIKIKHDNTRDKSNESSQSHEHIKTANHSEVQLEIQSLSKNHLCATIAQHYSCKHHVLCALNHIRIGSVSLQCAFALDNRKRHEISDTQMHKAKIT